VESAVKYLSSPPFKYKIIISHGGDFHLVALGAKDTKLIRITLDEITEEDTAILKDLKEEYELSSECSVEIWCKKHGIRGFSAIQKNKCQ